MTDRGSGRDETEGERLDRNLGELLQELRVILPGVQVLFAFLLAVPFQQNFTKITSFQQTVYFVTLLLTAITAVLLISPSAYHRITFRMRQKDHLITLANRFAIAGVGTLALAMTGAIVLITDVLYGATATAVTGVLALFTFALFWYLLPLKRRLSSTEEPDPPDSDSK
jgi:membrane-associated HD superfamily phosphohydrolase